MRACEPGRVEVVGLPAEGRAQAVERTSEVLGLGCQRRLPTGVAVGHRRHGETQSSSRRSVELTTRTVVDPPTVGWDLSSASPARLPAAVGQREVLDDGPGNALVVDLERLHDPRLAAVGQEQTGDAAGRDARGPESCR